ncbi:hypothetical protein EV193_106203 [Herbihabitans rhizosphaerae]|uniref:Uncharacterized protein n=1 Tax=Herbihabitans rhizosphaerae TaxID=1872711 RepID=A0A4Q7KK42_9PSEU|nr:hypothetical protein EV193_106203 [Herbihabitans rhizosphaerae]
MVCIEGQIAGCTLRLRVCNPQFNVVSLLEGLEVDAKFSPVRLGHR